MASPVTLTPDLFPGLIQHLVNLEESQPDIRTAKYIEPAVRELLPRYARALSDLIPGIRTTPRGDNRLPFVVIGSEVEVEVPGKGLYVFDLVGPYDADEDAGRVSYLSVPGSMSLLKTVGEEIRFPVSQGFCPCRVRAVTLRKPPETLLL